MCNRHSFLVQFQPVFAVYDGRGLTDTHSGIARMAGLSAVETDETARFEWQYPEDGCWPLDAPPTELDDFPGLYVDSCPYFDGVVVPPEDWLAVFGVSEASVAKTLYGHLVCRYPTEASWIAADTPQSNASGCYWEDQQAEVLTGFQVKPLMYGQNYLVPAGHYASCKLDGEAMPNRIQVQERGQLYVHPADCSDPADFGSTGTGTTVISLASSSEVHVPNASGATQRAMCNQLSIYGGTVVLRSSSDPQVVLPDGDNTTVQMRDGQGRYWQAV